MNWALALDHWTKHTQQDFSKVRVLEIGSRNGGLSLWIALQGGRVVCSDLNGPNDIAHNNHLRAGVSQLIEYRALDACNMPFQDEFDIVMSKSVLGGIGGTGGLRSQKQAVQQVWQALKPGGEFFFAENLTASALHQYLRKRFVAWAHNWRYLSIAEMRELLADFSNVQFITLGFLGAFGRTEKQRAFFGRIDRLGLDRCVPANWRYVMVGIARK